MSVRHYLITTNFRCADSLPATSRIQYTPLGTGAPESSQRCQVSR